ncbi:MAG: hypothetical protein FWG46_04120 [Treponema sp.]|nr:hypothetical protein [Treponema sp.]
MSYSRNYQASVSYEGYKTVNYGASQSGGSMSVHYSGTIPVNITINVDTDPFDSSVNGFSNSVDVLTGSVVAMNAAQCAAIQKTADDVSTSIINGFFGTINTELSQQMQALDSAIKAGLGLIMQQGKAVTEKKAVMEGDYNRISSRYVRLFADLDSECYKRIYTLDKQSFSLSEKVQKELLTESASNAAAMNLMGIEEVSSSKTFMFISSLNRKALDVLTTLHNYITQESKINALVNSFLLNEPVDEYEPLAVPVIWAESDLPEGGSSSECYIPDCFDQQKKQAIAEKVNAHCRSASPAAWKTAGETEKGPLNRDFNVLAETYFADADEEQQRVYRTMLNLWQNAQLSYPGKEQSL